MDTHAQRSFAPGRSPSLRSLLMLAGVLLCFSGTTPASAATVLRLDMQSLVANSDQIIEGEVTAVEARVENGRVYTYTTVQVKDAFKGAQAGEVVTIKQIGGRTPELATRVAGSPNFQSGEHVIVFLEKATPRATPVITGMAQGKFHIALGPDNVTPYVVPYLGDLALAAPAVDSAKPADPLQAPQPQPQSATPTDASAARFRLAEPAELYQRVTPLTEFRQQIRRVVAEQK